ncbi:MAG: Lrp/AsnC family transcriptional regulator [Gammaproteobacteria bacterium]|nr:Lrp/AsnC family transcriptional regulator [Gammaproteobacteria bacterium]MDH4253565.1 Lrp/AsnC family transcriptional regulator [Gammaproteobacteria bacterium]MDH5310415.1 Lrp/AsnC family transcriptional regulator [Gammaproteobacteria bacterium]
MSEFDLTDRKILATLQSDGRISNSDLARKIGLSESPCLRRVRNLEAGGVVAGYSALLDHRRLGLEIVAYVQVNLDQRSEADTSAFVKAVRNAPWIVECVAISGQYDYLLKVAARNIDHFGELTMKNLLRFPGVKDVSSSLVLASIKHNFGNTVWPIE